MVLEAGSHRVKTRAGSEGAGGLRHYRDLKVHARNLNWIRAGRSRAATNLSYLECRVGWRKQFWRWRGQGDNIVKSRQEMVMVQGCHRLGERG